MGASYMHDGSVATLDDPRFENPWPTLRATKQR